MSMGDDEVSEGSHPRVGDARVRLSRARPATFKLKLQSLNLFKCSLQQIRITLT